MKREFFLFLLLSIVVNIPIFKRGLHGVLIKTLYYPAQKIAAFLQDISKAEVERDSLAQQLAELKEKFYVETVKQETLVKKLPYIKGNITAYNPLGIPRYITLKVKNPLRDANFLALDIYGNLAGKLFKSEDGVIEIMTIFNKEFRIGVKNVRTGTLGILYGSERPEVRFIPLDISFRKGDTLVTAGIGEFKVAGIPVGIVDTVLKDENNPLFKKCKVLPFFQPYRNLHLLLRKGK